VEALASNTPLIVTKSSLTESLFGDWAILVDNNLESLTTAIRSLNDDRKDLRLYREQWNEGVRCGIAELKKVLEDCPDLETLSTAPGGASPRPERIHVGD
jgi:glycosyltransferase involved in cell wall biosynthesis